jgi:glycogen operon protein
VNWNLNEIQQDFLEFCQQMIALRQSSKLLSQLLLDDDKYTNRHNVEKIYWYRPDGERKVEDDWHDHNNQAFALELRGASCEDDNHQEHWLLVFNASDHDVCFQLPQFCETKGWQLVLDTRYAKCAEQPNVVINYKHFQAYRSISVFKCVSLN